MPGYARIPQFIRDEIARCSSDTFYVGKARTFPISALAADELAHLEISWTGAEVAFSSPIVPSPENGRWSRYNTDGRAQLRKDLPKVSKLIGGWQVPNFGDWGRGSHTHYSTREVFQQELWYGQGLGLIIDVQPSASGQVTIGFRVDRVFDRTNLSDRDLRLAISLLRENAGSHASIVATELSTADWLSDQKVTWEILPRGQATFERVLARLGGDPRPARVIQMQDRYSIIESMHPGAVVVGTGEFSRYFGFKFREDLVALENLDYGNALYLMYEDWEVLSQRTRVDLLADANANYDRVIHSDGWEDRLRAHLLVRGHDPSGGTAT